MDLPANPTFRHLDGPAALAEADLVVRLYEVCNPELLVDPFYSPERFRQRLHGYTASPGFECVLAVAGDDAVGQVFGYPLPTGARWWDGLLTPTPAGFTTEDGNRTFAVNEIMVLPSWRRRGVARALHDELLRGRPELRATLLVDPENVPARTAYTSWGWRDAGRLQPYPDAPRYHAMVVDLPPRPPPAPEQPTR